jgi:hypothetical protein
MRATLTHGNRRARMPSESGIIGRPGDDQDGALGPVEEGAARFAEGDAASGARAARADDEKVYPGGEVKQRLSRLATRYVDPYRSASGA